MDTDAQAVPVHVHHTTHIRGIVLPQWVAIILGAVAFVSALVLLSAVFLFRDAMATMTEKQESALADQQKATELLTKEIRLLQLHTQDVQNTLIRHGLARREDFAPWPDAEKK